MKIAPLGRQQHAGGQLAFGKGDGESLADTHHFAGGAHFRAEHDIDAGEFSEREHAFFDRHVGGDRFPRSMPCSSSEMPAMTLAAMLATGMPVALATKGDRAAGTGIHFQDVEHLFAVLALHGVLNVHQTDHAHVHGHRAGGVAGFPGGLAPAKL